MEVKMVEKIESRSSGFATTALVVGIVAAVFGWTGPFGLVLAIVAIIFGVVALIKNQSKVKAIWGIALGAAALLTAIIVLSIASAVVDELKDNGTLSTGDSASQTAPETTFAVGQAIDFDSKKVTVTSAERNWQSGNQFITPESGNEFVKVQVTIENNSNSQVSYNTFDWKMQDSQGVIKDIDSSTFTIDGGLNSGDLAKGGKVSGFMIFQVPANDSGLVISYSPSFFSDKKIQVKI